MFLYCYLDTPKKDQDGVNYYQHFRKDYIKPYGLAYGEDSFKDTTLVNRLKSFNCKFFLRPHVGLSEFSETIIEKARHIKENLDIFDVVAIQRFLDKTDGILQSLQTVNQKGKSGTGKIVYSY